MDPNETLRQIHEITERVLDRQSTMPNTDLTRLAELIDSLDVWIQKGGFLPDAWQR